MEPTLIDWSVSQFTRTRKWNLPLTTSDPRLAPCLAIGQASAGGVEYRSPPCASPAGFRTRSTGSAPTCSASVEPRVLAIAGAALLAVVLLVLVVATNPFSGGGNGETRVVTIAVATDNAQQAPVGVLGFPLVATRNTTRISGPDPDRRRRRRRSRHPSSGARGRPARGGDPGPRRRLAGRHRRFGRSPGRRLRLPVLISQHGAVPDATTQALAQLDPKGGGASGDVAVYSAGGASVPSGLKSREIHGRLPGRDRELDRPAPPAAR